MPSRLSLRLSSIFLRSEASNPVASGGLLAASSLCPRCNAASKTTQDFAQALHNSHTVALGWRLTAADARGAGGSADERLRVQSAAGGYTGPQSGRDWQGTTPREGMLYPHLPSPQQQLCSKRLRPLRRMWVFGADCEQQPLGQCFSHHRPALRRPPCRSLCAPFPFAPPQPASLHRGRQGSEGLV